MICPECGRVNEVEGLISYFVNGVEYCSCPNCGTDLVVIDIGEDNVTEI